tara:strand:- start:13125 stop:14180 length:1056 start_codon:yes stop_codon:yes gene_type:complete
MLLLINIIYVFGLFIFLTTLSKKNKFTYDLSSYLLSIPYFIFVGFRDITYGEDSINYYFNYFKGASINFVFDNFLNSSEIGFQIICLIIGFFGQSWRIYAIGITIIFLILVFLISKKTRNDNAYLFVIILLNSIIFIENSTNIVRSTLCSLISFYAFLLIKDGQRKGYLVLIFGFLTHYLQSLVLVFIFLTSYLLQTIKFKINHIKIIFWISCFFIILKTFTPISFGFFLDQRLVILNSFLSDNNLVYQENQIIGLEIIPLNIFIQLLIYVLIPLFFVINKSIKSNLILNYCICCLFLYSVLYPNLIFALRIIPILLFITLFLLVKLNFKSTYLYVFSALLIHLIVLNGKL